jgi:hypothetical protein
MKKGIAAACGLALLAVAAVEASAQGSAETGMASIHTWVKVGRKTCMLDHYHDGNGSGATRKEAERSAIVSWAEFTGWEYGSPWGKFANAASKRMDCSPGGGGWTCHVQARPCRPY